MGYTDHKRKPKGYAKPSYKDSGNKTLTRTTCSSCGAPCQVPFKPNGKKPIYCNNCFQKDNPDFSNKGPSHFNKDRNTGVTLEQINAKLDQILRLLD